jgi:NAD(P)-dependent dehydrogenase (short-subunit alcohol dehydrogenase family)
MISPRRNPSNATTRNNGYNTCPSIWARNAAVCAAVHTATGGRCPVARHTAIRASVHTTARSRRTDGISTHRAGFCVIRHRRIAPFRADLSTSRIRCIGRATAQRLARDGALVAVHYGHDSASADEVVATIEKDGGAAFAVRAELGVPGDVHELFLGLEAGLKERTGSTDLHILEQRRCHGRRPAGGSGTRTVRPALLGQRRGTVLHRAACAGNIPDGGRIISSGLTRFANPQEIAYAMTKGAVDQLTLHYAKHLGPRGVMVNSVGPGITDNGSALFDIPQAVEQMSKLSVFGRVGETDDVAAAVAFLARDDARWITGSYIDASGGTLLGG